MQRRDTSIPLILLILSSFFLVRFKWSIFSPIRIVRALDLSYHHLSWYLVSWDRLRWKQHKYGTIVNSRTGLLKDRPSWGYLGRSGFALTLPSHILDKHKATYSLEGFTFREDRLYDMIGYFSILSFFSVETMMVLRYLTYLHEIKAWDNKYNRLIPDEKST